MIRKLLLLWITVAAVLFCSGCAKNGAENSDSRTMPNQVDTVTANENRSDYGKSHTLMIYMVGSDLETRAGAGTDDLIEIENSGIDTSFANVVVYAAGTPYWHNDVADGEYNNILKLTDDRFESVEKFESVSMCESETLTFFLDYVYNNFNSESYSLILWNHGSGPVIGYGMDIVFEKDALTLEEMGKALENSPFGADNKLSWVGFDACLMASAELSYVWADYADFLVASQEIEPAFGWNYDFLGSFANSDTKALLSKIVDGYNKACIEYYERKGYENKNITLSCVDLSYVDELENAINVLFAKAVEDMPESYNELVRKRVETRAYGRASTGSEYDLVDLKDLALQMSSLYPKEAEAICSVIDKIIVFNVASGENCCGLSLYYPFYNKYYFENGWSDTYEGLGVFEAYQKYLSEYEVQWLERRRPEMGVTANIISSDLETGLYTLALAPEQNKTYASAKYYIFEHEGWGMYTEIYQSSDVTNKDGVLSANFDGNVIYAYNDAGTFFIPVIQETDNIGDYTHYSTRLVLSEYYNFGAELMDSLKESFDDLEEDLEIDNGTYVEEQETESEISEQQDNDGTDMCHGRMHFTYNKRTEEFNVASFVTDNEDETSVLSRGKAEEIDISEWHSYVFPCANHLYLVRNDDGSIKPVSKWIDTGWLSHYETAVNDGLYYTYSPLYDGNFYILFEIEDTSGNKYCSELLPIKNAELYQGSGEQMQETQINWSDGESVHILNEENVELSMYIRHDYGWSGDEDYKFYSFGAKNNGENRVDVIIGDFVINDAVYAQNAHCFLYPKGGEYYEDENGLDFDNEIATGVFDEMKSISFTVEIKDTVTGAYVMLPKRYEVNISGDAKFDSRSTLEERVIYTKPYLGAFADSQIIHDSETMTVNLLGFGESDAWYNSYKGYISIENKSDGMIICSLEAVSFNDITCNGTGNRVEIPQGCTVHFNVNTFDMAELGITEISKIDIGVSVWQHNFIGGFGEIIWCPVVLTQKSDAVQEFSEYDTLVYEKDGIRISLSDIKEENGTDRIYVSVINNTDKSITVSSTNNYHDGIYTDSGIFKGMEMVGPYQKRIYYELIEPEEIKEAEFNLMILNFSEEEIYRYEEEPIKICFD